MRKRPKLRRTDETIKIRAASGPDTALERFMAKVREKIRGPFQSVFNGQFDALVVEFHAFAEDNRSQAVLWSFELRDKRTGEQKKEARKAGKQRAGHGRRDGNERQDAVRPSHA